MNTTDFGPQATELTAIINRIGTLTDSELATLKEQPLTRQGDLDDEEARALQAMNEVGISGDSGFVATDAAFGALGVRGTVSRARTAAANAATGTMARHLIGEDFTQADYDSLVAAWAAL